MKKIFYALALFSAFFVFDLLANEGAPDDFPSNLEWPGISPQSELWYTLSCRMSHLTTPSEMKGPNPSELAERCMAYARSFFPSDGCSYWPRAQVSTNTSSSGSVSFNYSRPEGVSSCQGANSLSYAWKGSYDTPPTCPPDAYPLYKNPYYKDGEIYSCHKESDGTEEPEPEEPDPNDNGCDEFGDNSFLPPKDSLGVPAGGSVCHTLSDGTQCAYKKDPFGTGFEQTGQSCSPEDTPYGEPELPPNNPDDPDACAVVGSVEFFALCPVDPNEECNQIIITGDGGDMVHHDCPAGCGSINGQFVCAHEDKNANGIPDKDETDPDNPDPDNPDPDNPDPNNPDEGESADLTRTNTLLSGLDSKVGIGNSRLSDIKAGIDGMTNEQKKGNGSLAAIASNTAKTANNTKGTSENTAEILKSISETDVSNTFNPESAASFYESEYEDGFGGVWQEKSGEFQQTEAYQFLQQFKFNGGGAAPDTSICFNLGQFMDFGCSELPVPDAGLLAILKVFILISAAFLCRKLIFGG